MRRRNFLQNTLSATLGASLLNSWTTPRTAEFDKYYGLIDEMENPDTENVELMKAANQKISRWMNSQF